MAKNKTLFHRAVSFCIKTVLWFFFASIAAVIVLRWLPPPTSSFMLLSYASTFTNGDFDYRVRYHWRHWEEISADAKLAVIASEDQRFPEHHGFDVNAIADAVETYANGGRLRGASTISQQVAKNLFLWSGRSIPRKLLEAYFTGMIELFWPKRRTLEVYLNIAEFGPGIYGIGAAAQAFFHKPAAALSKSEAALLAAVLPNPVLYQARHPSRYVQKRRAWIMKQMDRLGGWRYLKKIPGADEGIGAP